MAGRNRNNRHQSPMPLEDLLVLDLCSYTSGSTAAVMMADFGAEVIKVEQPPLGDGNRNQPPFVKGKNGQKMGASFFRQGRNKQSIALDLYVPEGQRILKEMAKSADVLIENFKPGTMGKMGLGYETLHELNPKLIYASISGFGHRDCYDDSYRLRGMFDPVAQALSGVMVVTGSVGGPPAFCGSSVCDITPALLCAYGILTAVLHRQKTGKGQQVDIAMYDAGVFLSDKPVTHYLLAQEEQERGRISHSQPYDVFQAKDGWVVIAVTSQPMWQRFCQVIGREDLIDDPRTATGQDRYRNFDSFLKPAIEGWLKDKTRKEAVAILNSVNVPAGEVQTMADIAACPQLQARGMWLEVDDPVFGKVQTVANPVKLSDVKPRQPTHYPLVGQDTEAILARFDPDQVPTLRSK